MELLTGKTKIGKEVQLSYYAAKDLPDHFNLVKEASDSIYIKGFTYFSLLDVGKPGEHSGYQFIVAHQEKNILGILLFARFNKIEELCTVGGTLSLFYVDVREDTRNVGIAKNLFKGFAKYLDTSSSDKENIRLSYETILGEKAKIHSMAKEILKKHFVS